MEVPYMARMVFLLLIIFSALSTILADSGDWFLQPFNKTVDEGLGVIFNCVRTSNSTGQPEMATWVVNGFRYYWTDFRSLHGFIFISHNNSLVLYNISRRLDGYTFQCIIDRQASQIAYLTVWYPLSTTTAVLNQSKSLNGGSESAMSTSVHPELTTASTNGYDESMLWKLWLIVPIVTAAVTVLLIVSLPLILILAIQLKARIRRMYIARDVILLKRKSNGTSQERATCSIKQSDCNLIICKDRHQLQTGKQRRHRIDV